MASAQLTTDFERVFGFVAPRAGLFLAQGMRAIGLERDGVVIAGAVFEGINRFNAWVHLAAEPGARWMTREYLFTCFDYAFNQLGVQRLSGTVPASNTQARRFDEHIGFKHEATLAGAAADGSDMLVYVMRREDCRFLGLKG